MCASCFCHVQRPEILTTVVVQVVQWRVRLPVAEKRRVETKQAFLSFFFLFYFVFLSVFFFLKSS